MAAAAAAFLAESVVGLLVVLAGLGVQAALFGPVKYGLLRSISRRSKGGPRRRDRGDTILSIVCGTVAGSALVPCAGHAWRGARVSCSHCWSAGRHRDPPRARRRAIAPHHANVFAETWRVLRDAPAVRPIWLCVLGLSWFWTMGAT